MIFEHKNMTKGQKYLAGVVVLVLVFIGMAFLTKNVGQAPTLDDNDLDEMSAILVLDQAPGVVVTISELNLHERLWVAVYEEANGGKGNILGAGRFVKGEHSNAEIDLLRTTEVGKRYYVVIHQSDGNDIFDFNRDIAIEKTQTSFIVK
jgi:hypothetical protein